MTPVKHRAVSDCLDIDPSQRRWDALLAALGPDDQGKLPSLAQALSRLAPLTRGQDPVHRCGRLAQRRMQDICAADGAGWQRLQAALPRLDQPDLQREGPDLLLRLPCQPHTWARLRWDGRLLQASLESAAWSETRSIVLAPGWLQRALRWLGRGLRDSQTGRPALGGWALLDAAWIDALHLPQGWSAIPGRWAKQVAARPEVQAWCADGPHSAAEAAQAARHAVLHRVSSLGPEWAWVADHPALVEDLLRYPLARAALSQGEALLRSADQVDLPSRIRAWRQWLAPAKASRRWRRTLAAWTDDLAPEALRRLRTEGLDRARTSAEEICWWLALRQARSDLLRRVEPTDEAALRPRLEDRCRRLAAATTASIHQALAAVAAVDSPPQPRLDDPHPQWQAIRHLVRALLAQSGGGTLNEILARYLAARTSPPLRRKTEMKRLTTILARHQAARSAANPHPTTKP